MPRTSVTGDSPVGHLPFSPAIRAGDFVFVSGQASVDDSGTHVPGTLAEEMDLAFAKVERILAAAGGGLADVVQVRSYLSESSSVGEYNLHYRGRFADPPPARTTLVVGLGAVKFEVDVVAYIPVLG